MGKLFIAFLPNYGAWPEGMGPGIGAFGGGGGLGVRDPRPRIGIVICPLIPFWRAGRPV